MSFILTFTHINSPTYPDIVALARRAATYAERQEGRRLIHIATFDATIEQLDLLTACWERVRSWKSAQLTVDTHVMPQRDGWRVLEVLQCAGRAARFTPSPPSRYCRSAPAGSDRWPGRPLVPCRLLELRHGPALESQIDWTDQARRLDQLRALVLERGVWACPFWQDEAFAATLSTWTPTGTPDHLPAGPLDETDFRRLLGATDDSLGQG